MPFSLRPTPFDHCPIDINEWGRVQFFNNIDSATPPGIARHFYITHLVLSILGKFPLCLGQKTLEVRGWALNETYYLNINSFRHWCSRNQNYLERHGVTEECRQGATIEQLQNIWTQLKTKFNNELTNDLLDCTNSVYSLSGREPDLLPTYIESLPKGVRGWVDPSLLAQKSADL